MGLLALTKIQLSQMFCKKEFKISFTIMLVYAIATNIYYASTLLGWDFQELYQSDAVYAGGFHAHFNVFFLLLFPIIIAFPFVMSLVTDRKFQVVVLLQTRMKRQNYFYAKLIACFVGAFAICFIPFIINILLNLISFPMTGYRDLFNESPFVCTAFNMDGTIHYISDNYFFPSLYYGAPHLYNVVFAFICSAFAGIAAVFACGCSFFIKKQKLMTIIPFTSIAIMLSTLNSLLNMYFQQQDPPIYNYINPDYTSYIMPYDSFGNAAPNAFWYAIALSAVLLIASILLTRIRIKNDQLN